MLQIFLFSFVASICTVSFGHLLHQILFKNGVRYKVTLSECGILGFIIIGFLSFFLNFFFKISPIITNLLFLAPFLSFYLIRTQITKSSTLKFFSFHTLVALIVLLFLAYSNVYRPDAGQYHLPYTRIVNDFKIIIGVASLKSLFGTSSIIQYISAFFNNTLFQDVGITLPTALMAIYFIIYFFENFIRKNINIFQRMILFSFLSYIFLEMNRYSDYGNDNPGHLYFFYLTYLVFTNTGELSIKNFFIKKISLIAVFCFLCKPFLIFGLLYPFYFFIKFKKYKNIFLNIPLFPLIFLCLWIFKNLLVSGCFLYPIKYTCFSSLPWYSNDAKYHVAAQNLNEYVELGVKGWPKIIEYKNHEYKNYENLKNEKKIFLSNFNWLKSWIKADGHRTIIKKADLFILYLLLVFLLIKILTKSTRINFIKNFKTCLENENFKVIFIVSFIDLIVFFIKSPLGRYASGYLAVLIMSLFFPLYIDVFQIFENKRCKITIYSFLFFLLLIFSLKNLTRIYNNFDLIYYQSPWPKIYNAQNFNNNQKISFESIKKNNILKLYYSDAKDIWLADEKLCSYNLSPCSPNKNTFDQFNVDSIYGYYVLNLKK